MVNADALMPIMARIPVLAWLMASHDDNNSADNGGQMMIDNLDRAKVNHERWRSLIQPVSSRCLIQIASKVA